MGNIKKTRTPSPLDTAWWLEDWFYTGSYFSTHYVMKELCDVYLKYGYGPKLWKAFKKYEINPVNDAEASRMAYPVSADRAAKRRDRAAHRGRRNR